MSTATSKSILRRLAEVLAIEQGEGVPVSLMMSVGILIGIARMLLYTAGYGLFLEQYGSGDLPMLYIAVSVIAAGLSGVYLRISNFVNFRTLIIGNLLFSAGVTVVLWVGLGQVSALLLALPVWYETLEVLTTLAFWSLAGRVLNVRQGKRLFGLLGTGDRFAEIVVGFCTPLLVAVVGTAGLLPLGGAAVALAVVPTLTLFARYLSDDAAEDADSDDSDEDSTNSPLMRLLSNRYIAILVLQVLMTWIGFFIADLVFYNRLEIRYTDADKLAGFLGIFNGLLGAVGLIGQSFLSSRILAKIGVAGGILVLPLTLVVGSVGAAALIAFGQSEFALFAVIVTIRFMTGSLIGITDGPATLLLFQPIAANHRTRVQGFVDGVVYPIAVGVAGALLWILQDLVGAEVRGLVWTLVLVVVVWTVTAYLLGREYPEMVKRALQKRLLDDSDLGVIDAHSKQVLVQSLAGQDARQMLYALDLLRTQHPTAIVPHITNLLASDNEQVLCATISVIEERLFTEQSDAMCRLAESDPRPFVRAAALSAYCALEEGGLKMAEGWLQQPDRSQQEAALTAILKHGSLAHIIRIGPRLLQLEHSQDIDDHLSLLRIIEAAKAQSYYQPVRALLLHSDDQIWAKAAAVAGKLEQPKLLPALVTGLLRPTSRIHAIDALRAYGSAFVDFAPRLYDDQTQKDPQLLAAIIDTFASIDDPRIIEKVKPHVMDVDDAVQDAALRTLRAKRFTTAYDDPWFVHVFELHSASFVRFAHLLVIIDGYEAGTDSVALPSLRRVVVDVLRHLQQRLFDLLGLNTQKEAIEKIRLSLDFGQDAEKGLALESLEMILPPQLRRQAMAILDPQLTWQERLTTLQPQPSTNADELMGALRKLLQTPQLWPNHWVRINAAFTLHQEGNAAFVQSLARSDDPLLAQFINQLEVQDQEDKPMLSIEKVAVLRSTDIFRDTPDFILAHLANIAEERALSPGEVFIHEGEFEHHMYVVVDGEVDVLVGGHTVATLKEGAIVGEMQIIDPAPRSATVQAKGEVLVFKIGREAFEQVMAERPEISRAINRMLVRRLRSQTQ